MLPLYFGTSGAQLFGLYHPAETPRARTCGVVVCPPFGHEYIRAHRALRQVAILLSASGFHVLRFDYFGTGDSAGESHEGSVATWLSDIGMAVEELKDTADVRRVCLVGLRLGATLAAHVAEHRSDIDTILLWDAVVSGRVHLAQLRTLQQRWLQGRPGSRFFAFKRRVPEVIGFPVTPTLRQGLEELDLTSLRSASVQRIIVAASEDQSGQQEWVLGAGAPTPSDCWGQETVPGDWHRPDLVHTALLAPRVGQRVAGLVREHVR